MGNSTSNSTNAAFLYIEGAIVPEDVTYVYVDTSVTAIPTAAFEGRRHLKEVDLPEGLQEIGRCAFYGCTSLERINLPSTITDIGHCAFRNCTSLREVKLFGGIQDIGWGVFQGCSSLERIMISSRAFGIEYGVNHNCRSFTSGTILPTNLGQVMIAPECLESMSGTDLTEVAGAINGIINGSDRTRNLERIRALFELINCGFDMNIIRSNILPFL